MTGRVWRPKGSTSWYYVVDVGRDADGKRRQRKRGGFATKREAEAALREVVNALDAGSYVAPDQVTVARFLVDEWLPSAARTLRPASHDQAQRLIRQYVVPTIGAVQLQRLSPAHLNALYAQLLATGRRDGTGLSPQTVALVHARLRRALGDAVKWGKVPRNVASLVAPPKVPKPALTVWDREDLRAFLEHVADDRLHAMWLLFATTGMRRGEVLGLRWVDVDLEASEVRIRQQRTEIQGRVHIGEPKSAAGRRTIALDPHTAAALRSYRQAQRRERMAWGPAWVDTGLVFTRENGEGLYPSYVSQLFVKHARAAKLPAIRLHDVRHSYATAALRAGVPVEVLSPRLGHGDIAITLRAYRHVRPGEDAAAARLAAEAIFR